MTDAATAVGVQPPTLTAVIDDLFHKHWVTRQRALHDDRAVCLRLSRHGQVVVQKIKDRVRDVKSDLIPMKEA